MSSPDLGGGRRLRRRPRSFLTSFYLFFILFSFPLSSSIPKRAVSGECDSSPWVRSITPPFFTAISTVRVPSRNLFAITSGGFRPVILELHCFLLSCIEVSVGFRSEVSERLKTNSNPRSDSSSSLLLRCSTVSDVQLYCYHRIYAKKSLSLFQLRKLRYTSKRLTSKASLDLHSRDVRQTVLVEASLYSHCFSRPVRYNFFTPYVLNLLSKLFFGNFGMNIHGIDGVPDPMGIVTGSIYYVFWRKAPTLDRKCYRLCTASILGLVAQYEHTDIISSEFITGDLFMDLSSQTLSSQTIISDSPDFDRCFHSKEAACSLLSKLGQHWIFLMGHEPSFALLMGFKTQIVVPCIILWALWPFVRELIVNGG